MSWLLCRKPKKAVDEKKDLEKARASGLISEKEFLFLTAERAKTKYDGYLDLEKLKSKTKKKR